MSIESITSQRHRDHNKVRNILDKLLQFDAVKLQQSREATRIGNSITIRVICFNGSSTTECGLGHGKTEIGFVSL